MAAMLGRRSPPRRAGRAGRSGPGPQTKGLLAPRAGPSGSVHQLSGLLRLRPWRSPCWVRRERPAPQQRRRLSTAHIPQP